MSTETRLNITVPLDLKDRAYRLSRHLKTTVSQIVRDGFRERVEQLEKKEREEREQKRRERERHPTRGLRPLRGLNDPPPSEPPPVEEEEEREAPAIEASDGLDTLYEHHARRILATANQPTERRLCIAEAFAAVKRQNPLMHPPDPEIERRLVSTIDRVRRNESAAAPATSVDAVEGALSRLFSRTIDPSKTITYGNIKGDE